MLPVVLVLRCFLNGLLFLYCKSAINAGLSQLLQGGIGG